MGLADFFDPTGTISGQGAQADILGPAGQTAFDPLDLFGVRAGQTADEVNRLQQLAAQEGIDFQRGQLEQVQGMFDPFVQAGATPLAELTQAFTGQGEFDFQPTPGFEAGLERGVRGTRRAAAARGLLDSSATEARLSDLVNALTEQETQQQIERRLAPIRTAQGAAGIIGQQAGQAAGQGSSIFGNLANQNLQTAQNLGQARQSAFSSAAGGLQGLANLLATQ